MSNGEQARQGEGGYMYLNLKSYLGELEAVERSKPVGKRRDVPTMTELARAVGMHKVSFSRLVTGQVRSLNFDVGAKILDELRRRGFETNPGDIIGYVPPAREG